MVVTDKMLFWITMLFIYGLACGFVTLIWQQKKNEWKKNCGVTSRKDWRNHVRPKGRGR